MKEHFIELHCIVLPAKIVRAVVGELLLGEKSRHLEGKMKVVSDLFFHLLSFLKLIQKVLDGDGL